MHIRYFEDTDTLLVEISRHSPIETQVIKDNLFLDLDENGKVVSITIEHASLSANVSEVFYQRVLVGQAG